MVRHILAVLLAAALIFFGVQKFGAENFIFERIAERSGISLFEPGVRVLTGLLEVTAGLMLILPRTRSYGAVLGTALVAGAIFFHLTPWLGIHTPASAGGEESIGLFMTAVTVFALSLANLFLNRTGLPLIGR
ncbi:DoxX family protein [Parvularcula sp. IMCC14364]|uniref:DoxX family protein n=1 Tax=Parvularcula sp. IMCC14364 TaxID=3067902 RepID=UPI0027419242|nr:DoxX family protein [Parvularcula sp. IMCC14364]